MKTVPQATIPSRDSDEPVALQLVADTLEARLTQAIADLRASPADPATRDEAFRHACRRDAIATIERARAIGLFRRATSGTKVTACQKRA
ncbi:hypothetical protein QH494_05160 [Sphingomonas sp. AR_OL41]|uniref:hypothetical protein n=1 Tax=Sphingomonas sp. AR_OL41 TaxID=3042729 RepID=UPI00247FC3E1|nr:hypothetical protein [Sphingomonas sp. AR_OL41]MDH7971563.1 hypothetical protein [Sphingomonas sp. AR_OL41]